MLGDLRNQFSRGRHLLTVNVESADVSLVDSTGLADGRGPVIVYDLQGALANYSRLVGDDETLKLYQITQVAACGSATIENWLRLGVLQASIAPGRGPGRERLFSFADGFLAGVLGALRRQGAGTQALIAVGRYLGYTSQNVKSTKNRAGKRIKR